ALVRALLAGLFGFVAAGAGFDIHGEGGADEGEGGDDCGEFHGFDVFVGAPWRQRIATGSGAGRGGACSRERGIVSLGKRLSNSNFLRRKADRFWKWTQANRDLSSPRDQIPSRNARPLSFSRPMISPTTPSIVRCEESTTCASSAMMS